MSKRLLLRAESRTFAFWLNDLLNGTVTDGVLHLPVDGRRFRPTLEDLIELLIVEQLVDARPGWKELVEQGRAGFQRIQLAAAVRSDRSTATDALHDLDISA